jgi:hypothetical protein
MRVGAMFSPKTRGFFHEKGKQIFFLAHEKSEIRIIFTDVKAVS